MRLGTILTLALVLFTSVSCMKKRVTGLQRDTRSLLDPSVGDPTVCPNGISATIVPMGIPSNGVLSFPVGSSVTFTIVASGCNFGYGVNVNGQLQRFSGSTQVTVTQPALAQSGRVQRFEISAYASALQTQVGRGPFVFNSTPFTLVADDTTEEETISFEPEGRVPVVANQVEFSIQSPVRIKINSITSPETGYIQGSVLGLSGEPAVATAVTYPFEVNANEFRKFRVRLSRGVPGNSSIIEIKYQKYNGTTLGSAEVTSSINTSHNAFPSNYPNDYLGQGYNQNLLYDPMSGGIFWSYDTSSIYQSSFTAPSGEAVRELLTGQLDNQNGADLLFVTRTSGTPNQAKFYVLRSNVITNSSNNNSQAVSFGPLLSCGAWSESNLPSYFILNPLSESRTEPSVYYINANNQIREARLTVSGSSCALSPVADGANISISVSPEVALNSNEQLCSGRRMKITWSGRGLGNYDSCRLLARVTGRAEEMISPGNVVVSVGSISQRIEFHSIQANTDYVVKCVRGNSILEEPRSSALGTCATYSAATGGTESIITVGSERFKVHTFSESGTLNVSDNSTPFEILVVAGGGGGGLGRGAGGGGAGGLIHRTDYRVSSTGSVAITVGGGGAAGANGSDSSLGSLLVAKGGGRGGNGENRSNQAGGAGGSGGGGGFKGRKQGAAGQAEQGNRGGNSSGGNYVGGGGGGGAGGAGQNTIRQSNGFQGGGPGGIGREIGITGSNVYYAGGGGGKGQQNAQGTGGRGGGGNGGKDGVAGTNGMDGLGGGGGAGANGGKGVVIVRYRIAPAP